MRTRSAVLAIPVLLIAGTAPFWDTKPAGDWALDEVRTLLTNSPWAQMMDAGPNNPAPVVQVYLATAEPMQLAEERMRAAAKVRNEDPSWSEYRDYMVDNGSKYIVVAFRALNPELFLDNAETKHMENDSVLRIGKRKYKTVGSFPPSSSDRYARLVFPRDVQPGDRSLIFDLYVPGAGSPYRRAEFAIKELVYRGRPSF